jgi:phosphocarrier protein HPr
MVRIDLVVPNNLGFHARAAGRFVQEAARFSCDIWLTKGVNRVNGKSIMGILTLAAAKGEVVVLEAEGLDEKDALGVLSKLVQDGFGEEEKENIENREQ